MELKPIRTDGEPVRRDFPYEAAADVLAAEQGRKVLRNTYLLLALTMVPTVIGAWIGMATGAVILANLFLQIPALALTISTLVVVVFSLFLLYDLQRIIRGGETNYIMAATGVYMSLWNIFANLLYLLMALTGERD